MQFSTLLFRSSLDPNAQVPVVMANSTEMNLNPLPPIKAALGCSSSFYDTSYSSLYGFGLESCCEPLGTIEIGINSRSGSTAPSEGGVGGAYCWETRRPIIPRDTYYYYSRSALARAPNWNRPRNKIVLPIVYSLIMHDPISQLFNLSAIRTPKRCL